MSRLPKLKVKRPFAYPSEEIRDFEEAKYFLFGRGSGFLIVAENRVIQSYEELVELAAEDSYKDKELLEVALVPIIGGG